LLVDNKIKLAADGYIDELIKPEYLHTATNMVFIEMVNIDKLVRLLRE